MKTVTFVKDEGTVFYKEFRRRVDHYFKEQGISKTGGYRMLIKIGLYFGLDILGYFLMMNSTTIFSFIFWYLFMGVMILLTAFNISHDAAHLVAVKSKWWNKLLFQCSFNLQGNNAYVWGKNHNESHHLYTNIEESDIDVVNNPLVRTSIKQPQKWFYRFQHFYVPFLYMFYSLNWFFMREGLMLLGYSSRTISVKIPINELFKLIFFKGVYIGFMLVIPMILMPFSFYYVLLAFILNHFLVSLIFTGVLAVSHLSDRVEHPFPDKSGVINMSWAKLQLKTSIDYNPDSLLLNWILGGFNAHTLHHLLPEVSHVHYLKLLPILRETCEEFGLEYNEASYGETLKSHFRFLRNMGCNQIKFEGYEK